MSEPADRTWTLTFPIEAAVFVATLIAVVVIAAAAFFLSWGTTAPMQGGGFDQGVVDFDVAPVPATTTVP